MELKVDVNQNGTNISFLKSEIVIWHIFTLKKDFRPSFFKLNRKMHVFYGSNFKDRYKPFKRMLRIVFFRFIHTSALHDRVQNIPEEGDYFPT